MNIIITSEMRVGSRWIHYLLSELLHMGVSPEIDVSKLKTCEEQVKQYFKLGRIVKFHHATPEQIREHVSGNYKILSIVRNPNDRITSWTFHQRYKPPGKGLKSIKQAPTDEDAVKVAFNDKGAQDDNQRQFLLMEKGMSTKNYKKCPKQDYLWTSYHWLITETFIEIKTICEFLGAHVRDIDIRRACVKHSFRKKSGRFAGEEKRDDEWRRKGIEGDHKSFFDLDMILKSKDIQFEYWRRIKDEESVA